ASVLKGRKLTFVEEEPGRVKDSRRGEHARDLCQVVEGLLLREMCEDGEGVNERREVVCHGDREHSRLRLPGIEVVVVDVVVVELEPGREGHKVFSTPGDHAEVKIDPDVPLRARALLDELARDSSATTAEVEDGRVRRGVEVRIHERSGGVVERLV